MRAPQVFLLLLTAALCGCSTSPLESGLPIGVIDVGTPNGSAIASREEVPTLDEAIKYATGVYLCDLRSVRGQPRLYISSVWLHGSQLGMSPPVGEELRFVRPPPPRSPDVTGILVFYYDPPLQRGRETIPARYFHVVDGRVPVFELSIEDAEKKVRNDAKRG